MSMARKNKPISLAIDPDILDRVELWIKSQELPVTKVWVFEKALKMFLEEREDSK